MRTNRSTIVAVVLSLIAAPSVLADGEPCNERGDCDATDWCRYPPGICYSDDPLGTCVQKTQICGEYWDPVCGCDWQTHSNSGCAYIEQVSILYEGACGPPVCGGYMGFPCAADEFCDVGPGQCGIYYGFCLPVPTDCPEVCEPLCGCDGSTCVSQCHANAAGTSVLHFGACESPTDGVVTGLAFDATGESSRRRPPRKAGRASSPESLSRRCRLSRIHSPVRSGGCR